MPKLVTKNFGLHLADVFKTNITNGDDKFYVFYSRINPWTDEAAPPNPSAALQNTEYDIWRGMVGLKKISNNDVSFAISREDWTTGTVYSEYSNLDANLLSSKYYVYTANGNVYKCLYNNNGAPSTVKPTGQPTTIISNPADGYKWKFMYTVSSAEFIKFGGTQFLPVKNLTADDSSPQWDVQQAASNGSVDIIDVTAGGSNYIQHNGQFTNGVTNTSVMFAANSASAVSNIYKDYTLFISSGQGAGQIKTIQSYDGSSKKITLASSFSVAPAANSTYHIGPAININGDGSGALAWANVISGAIDKVTVIDGGQNYSLASANVVHYGTYGQNAGLVPYLSPPGGHGSNPVSELNGRNVVVTTTVEGTENGKFVANNDFRVYGLIKNPVVRSTGSVATGTRYDQTLRFSLVSETGQFLDDEFISGATSGSTARVVSYSSNTIHLTNVSGSFSNLEIITANTSGVTATINSITQPEIKQFSGEVLYLVNQTAISRDIDQTENITITVKF